MNKNIKYTIYFLLGIILFYLMFNEKKVEGFDENSPYAYDISININRRVHTINCVKMDTPPEEINWEPGPNDDATDTEIFDEINRILSTISDQTIYYSNEDNNLFFIQDSNYFYIIDNVPRFINPVHLPASVYRSIDINGTYLIYQKSNILQ